MNWCLFTKGNLGVNISFFLANLAAGATLLHMVKNFYNYLFLIFINNGRAASSTILLLGYCYGYLCQMANILFCTVLYAILYSWIY